MESSTDDFGVQSLRDSMLQSEVQEDARLSSSPKEFEAPGRLDMSKSDHHQQHQESQSQSRLQAHTNRGRQDSEISSSSGTVLGTNRPTHIALDLSTLDPLQFSAIVDPANDTIEKADSRAPFRSPRTPPRASRSQTRMSTPPDLHSHAQQQGYDRNPNGGMNFGHSYPSPNSSTFSIHSSFISVSSLSRGSSPFEAPSAGGTDTPADSDRETGMHSREREREARTSPVRPSPAADPDVSLVLPNISLPGSLHPSRKDAPGSPVRPDPYTTMRDSSTTPHAFRVLPVLGPRPKGRRGPLDIALTGRAGSTRAFLSALIGCPEVMCCRVNRQASEAGKAGETGCEIAVFETSSEGNGLEDDKSKLVARLTVFDHGVGPLDQTLSAVEASYTRLNRLLRQDGGISPSSSDFERDTDRLVASWIESRKRSEIDVQRAEPGGIWYDFVIVTGERRYLLDQGKSAADGYETLVHLMSVVPAVCWPSELQDGLARHLPLPFFRLKASEAADHRSHGASPDPTPRCQANSNRIDSYFSQPQEVSTTDDVIRGLVDLLTMDAYTRTPDRQTLSRHNLSSVSVQHFVAWQRGLALSGAGLARSQARAVDSGVEGASPERSPTTPSRYSYAPKRNRPAAPNEWEAGLSRRHALRKRNEMKQHKKKRSVARTREGKPTARDGFWEAASSSTGTSSPVSEVTIRGSGHPVRRAMAAVMDSWRSATDDTRVRIQNPWRWIGWTCFGLAAGFGCVMLMKGWKDVAGRL